MSYILDALKKSERERPPGPVPDLFTVHGPQPPSPRWPTRAIVTGALLLGLPATALCVWFWLGAGGRGGGVTRPPVAASSYLRVGTPAAVVPRTATGPTPQSPALSAPASASAVRRPPGDRAATPATTARKERRLVAVSVEPAAVPVAAPAAAAPVHASAPALPGAPPPPGPAASDAPSSPAPAGGLPTEDPPAAAPPASPEPAPAAAAADEAPPADGHVLNQAELPAAIRSALPKLAVSGHVWSDEPSLRLLSLDDRLLHEGDEAAPGVSVREITPAGAVLVFKGWRFRVAGGRP